MKETTDPKTGTKELQTEEYMPAGPVKIAPSVSSTALDPIIRQLTTLTSQVASLQLAVAAIERRQAPLVQGGVTLAGWTCNSYACGVFNGEEKEPLTHCRSCGSSKPAA